MAQVLRSVGGASNGGVPNLSGLDLAALQGHALTAATLASASSAPPPSHSPQLALHDIAPMPMPTISSPSSMPSVTAQQSPPVQNEWPAFDFQAPTQPSPRSSSADASPRQNTAALHKSPLELLAEASKERLQNGSTLSDANPSASLSGQPAERYFEKRGLPFIKV